MRSKEETEALVLDQRGNISILTGGKENRTGAVEGWVANLLGRRCYSIMTPVFSKKYNRIVGSKGLELVTLKL